MLLLNSFLGCPRIQLAFPKACVQPGFSPKPSPVSLPLKALLTLAAQDKV